MPADSHAGSADDPFARYWECVRRLYGPPDQKSKAQAACAAPPDRLTSRPFVGELLEALRVKRWDVPATRMDSNWIWRHAVGPFSADRAEVKLERSIVDIGKLPNWTYQMSTMSGLVDERSHKRRAIDLVHRVGPGHYAFIELKIESNNPVFAAFEILGYGLTYCLARQHGRHGRDVSEEQNVMLARQIELVVLAPESWYRYKVRGRIGERSYALAWLTEILNDGLAQVPRALGLDGLDSLTFQFRTFRDETQLLTEVASGRAGGYPV